MGKCCLHASSFIFDRIIIKAVIFLPAHPASCTHNISLGCKVFVLMGPRMQWKCWIAMKNSVQDSLLCSWTHSYGIQRVPVTHRPRIVKTSLSKLLVTRTGIKARTSLISGRIRLLTLELLALEWWKFYTFELEYLWGQLTNLDQILCVASLGVWKSCRRFWGRLDQNSGVHGNRKPPLTYNGENGVSTFSQLLLIRSFLYLQVTRLCIKSRMSSNFDPIGSLTRS